MKRSVIILATLLSGFSILNAQTSFNCGHHKFCYWSIDSMNFENCKGFDEVSTFIISKDEKSISHKTGTLDASYSISGKKYYKENDITVYYVTSAEGNKYVYTFDPGNKEIGFVPDKDEKTVLQIFSIKLN